MHFKIHKDIIYFFVIVVISLVYYLDTFSSYFWIRDNHHGIIEYNTILRDSGYTGLIEKIYYDAFGHAKRFVPLFWTFFGVISIFLKANPLLWYILLSSLFFIHIFYSFKIFLKLSRNIFLSSILIIPIFAFLYNKEIFFRWGSAETFLAPILTLFFYIYLFKNSNKLSLFILLAALIGIKENFVFFSTIIFFETYKIIFKKENHSKKNIILSIFFTLYGLIFIYKISLIFFSGEDIRQVSNFNLKIYLNLINSKFLLIIFAFFISIIINFFDKKKILPFKYTSFIFLFIIFNFIFYKSIPGELNRYSFPYIYLIYFIICINIIIIYNNLLIKFKFLKIVYKLFVITIILYLCFNKILLNLETQKKLAKIQIKNFSNFQKVLDLSIEKNIENFLVTDKFRYSSYEGALSLKKYINFYIKNNKNIYLIIDDDKKFREKFKYRKQVDALFNTMRNWSLGKKGFSDISNFKREENFENCIELALTKKRTNKCKYSFYFQMI